MTRTLVLIRHGQSTWNLENRFTGWTDVGLTERGVDEAHHAATLLEEDSIVPDLVFTSLLKRAILTVQVTLEDMDLGWLPVERSWRLNERHYGALQGLDKGETAAKHGEDQVHVWRRSYATPPPALDLDDRRHPRHDARYSHLPPDVLPACESLSDVVDRMLPYWHDAIAPALLRGRTPIVSAHGNSLRALVKHLDGISDDEISSLNIPTGIPLVYRFDENLKVAGSGYLGDPDDIAAAAAEVAAQGRAAPTS
jgi:2,3-bisphosphoglycerate-dependent phosphoglycerate mutase